MENGTSQKTDSKNFKGGPPALPTSPFIQQNSMVATEPHPCLSQSSTEDMRAHQSAASSDCSNGQSQCLPWTQTWIKVLATLPLEWKNHGVRGLLSALWAGSICPP